MSNRTIASVLGGVLVAAPAFAYESSVNMPVGVTPISREVHDLHMLIFWVCVAIAVVVFGAMIYSIWKFRKSTGAVADQTLTHSTKVEVIWTAIPVVILISMAIPAAKTLVKMEDTRNAELTVKVTGYQWKWQYDYLGKGVAFYSTLASASNAARQLNSGVDVTSLKDYLLEVDHPLVVPVDTKVRLLLTGNDVIHSWWVPDFAVKKDAIPGFINEAWFKAEKVGRYTGQCAELCGRDHGFMPIVVTVVSKEEFAKWLAAQQEAAKAAAAGAQPAATTAMTAPAPAGAAL
ncbi:MAG: cytochrome c oxidase subunit II [Proteobacteria bacterium]|nr:cytochrome c oxidase subunit II [Pseudomonadota bacterium]